jgi:hypothetical protein
MSLVFAENNGGNKRSREEQGVKVRVVVREERGM